MDRGLLNGVLFLDLKKAFDTINHDILISKLRLYGVRGDSLIWFQSYIQQRKQVCSVNNTISNIREINCGVPQGSNLGPLLFLLYINDLPDCLETTNPALFADDTNISSKAPTPIEIETHLNKDLENVHTWLTANKLTLNKVKTEFMIIGSRFRLASVINNPKIVIGGQNIKQVKHKKTLGVILDDQLKWDKHNEYQCKKISSNIALLRRAKQFVPQEILLIMYNALVLPHFNYCSTIWCDESVNHVNKLSKLQKRAARVITGYGYDIRSSDIFEELDWIPIAKTLENRETLMTFKALTGRLPQHISDIFTKCHNENYSLRSNNNKLLLQKPNTNFLKRSFSYRAAKSWNELSDEITGDINTLSIASFKKRIKSILSEC